MPARTSITAEPRVRDLTRYRNKWVAVRDGEVLAEHATHTGLVRTVRAMQLEPGSYVARYIDAPSTTTVVGVG